jgi:hypothetical protein
MISGTDAIGKVPAEAGIDPDGCLVQNILVLQPLKIEINGRSITTKTFQAK